MTQISGEINNLDLYSEAREWCGIPLIDTTTLPLPSFIRSANFGNDRVTSLVLKSDGKWQFDDENLSTELLDVTKSLVSGTQKYELGASWLKIKKVRIKDSAGEWRTLEPVDRRQLSDAQLRQDAGDPRFYDKLGNYLYLHTTPNYASASGMEVQFQRAITAFAYNATTTEPGFASPFHRLIALYGALDYCEKNDLESRSVKIRIKIGTPPDYEEGIAGSGLEKELVDHYSERDTDQKVSLLPQREDYGQRGLPDNSGSIYTGRHPDRW